jgi:formyltetrahydrofolate-dependent phosphoribosylglycinamide formyltransferase
MRPPIRLGVLLSGGGTTLLNLIQHIEAGQLSASIQLVISTRETAGGLAHARNAGLPTAVIAEPDARQASEAMNESLRKAGVELVVLAGFLKPFFPASLYAERTINIHPSLLPAFCGHGYYGMRVHQAVHARGCRVSGCTVHLVNEEYDAGHILHQLAVELDQDDDPEQIRAKVFQAECQALPQVISWFQQGRVSFSAGRAHIAP